MSKMSYKMHSETMPNYYIIDLTFNSILFTHILQPLVKFFCSDTVFEV